MLFLFWLVLVSYIIYNNTVTDSLSSFVTVKTLKISNVLIKIKLCKDTITNSYTIALLTLTSTIFNLNLANLKYYKD